VKIIQIIIIIVILGMRRFILIQKMNMMIEKTNKLWQKIIAIVMTKMKVILEKNRPIEEYEYRLELHEYQNTCNSLKIKKEDQKSPVYCRRFHQNERSKIQLLHSGLYK